MEHRATDELEIALLAAEGSHVLSWDDRGLAHALARQIRTGTPLGVRQRRAVRLLLSRYPGAAPLPKVERAREPSPGLTAITIGVDQGAELIVVHSPFRFKELAKSIVMAKWDAKRNAWTYPATPTSAGNVALAYAGGDMDTAVATLAARPPDAVDPVFLELLGQHLERLSYGSYKTQDDLPPVPVTKTEAWSHQRQGFWFAKDLEACCMAIDMGGGKSKVAVDLATNNGAKKVLIVAPLKVVKVWPNQFDLHAGVPWRVVPLANVDADGKKRTVAQRVRLAQDAWDADDPRPLAIAINYEAVHLEPFGKWALAREWDYLILDEGHRIRSYNGVTSKFCAKLAKKATRRLALTGTPFPQTPLDIFGLYRALDPAIFGMNWTVFKHKFAEWGGFQGYEYKRPKNEEEFNQRFYSIAFRVEADDVLDLPEARDVTRPCELGPAARKFYDHFADHMIASFKEVAAEHEGVISADNALVKLLRLQQMTGGQVKDDDGNEIAFDDAKAVLLTEILDDLPADEPIVTFAWFLYDLDVIRGIAEKSGRAYIEVSGRANGLNEQAQIPDGFTGVLGIQIRAGGEGIDLSRSRFALYYSLGYSLKDYLQSRSRLVRPGQEHKVLFVHLVCAGTVDEQVYQALSRRQAVVDYILRDLAVTR